MSKFESSADRFAEIEIFFPSSHIFFLLKLLVLKSVLSYQYILIKF